MKTMNELILHFLQDIYYAEKLAYRSMAKVAKAVENADLKTAILKHRDETQTQVDRLAAVFAALGKKPRAKKCAAMDGLAEECNEAIEEGEKGSILDSALLACLQAVEHYEIARYGALLAWSQAAGNVEAAAVLEKILGEEKAADAKLSQIAKSILNPKAASKTEASKPAPAPARRKA